MDTPRRKAEHLRLCLGADVETHGGNGLEGYRFDPLSLPELDLDAVDTTTTLFGRVLQWPFLIGAMTGGTGEAAELNRRFALAAEVSGCGLVLGSLRPAIEDPRRVPDYDVRSVAPGLPLLLGNIGVAQVADTGLSDAVVDLCLRLRFDGLFVHLNPLQEALQAGGDTAFSGLTRALIRLRARLSEAGLFLGIKEVSCGMSEGTLRRLAEVAPDAIETAGTGGTSWARVEGLRSSDPIIRRAGETFADFGLPLAESVILAREAFPNASVIASGGLRSGLDLAKAIRLGASGGAMALPVLRAASRGDRNLAELIRSVRTDLRIAMFCTGSPDLDALARAPMRGPDGRYLRPGKGR